MKMSTVMSLITAMLIIVIMTVFPLNSAKNIYIFLTGFAIFFEFKHFKPKKAFTSTRCWTFMEQDEIKEGPLALEL